ncbi:hypothetical protein XarbCFBP7408_08440 [Xanthomonas arboricola pv. guizotiae]|nr:hypothetical protein XarbCFBP7408_08440 [Xanthomonas arboricola pv. guizotiae]
MTVCSLVFSPRKLVNSSMAVRLMVQVLGKVLPLRLVSQASRALPRVIVSMAGFVVRRGVGRGGTC